MPLIRGSKTGTLDWRTGGEQDILLAPATASPSYPEPDLRLVGGTSGRVNRQQEPSWFVLAGLGSLGALECMRRR
jgi:hypothetical protein